jgi:hypothetical protein
LTQKFPVVGEDRPLDQALDPTRWSLSLGGLLARPVVLGWDDWLALPLRERRVDIHCVTGWSRLATVFRGLPLAELLAPLGIAEEARFVRFEAWSERAHDTSLPLDLALDDTWLVDRVDGAPLSAEHGGPVRTITPSRYFYKSLKWVRSIEALAENRLGYWERESSYHDGADPWPGDQRFTTGSLRPEQVERLREAASLAPWRSPRKVLLGLDLQGWEPRDRNLAGIQLKNCVLRGARFAGCDLRGANFSLSDLRGADLRGVDASGADFEGCDLRGADLRDANFEHVALSAAKLIGEGEPAALVEGLRWSGARGLLEDQEAFLERAEKREGTEGQGD